MRFTVVTAVAVAVALSVAAASPAAHAAPLSRVLARRTDTDTGSLNLDLKDASKTPYVSFYAFSL